MTTSPQVLVLGAGITGLVAAFRLQQQGFSVQVLDAASRAGGAIWSVQQDGYRLEMGPNSLMATPTLRGLVTELGLAADFIPASKDNSYRYILRDGKLQGIKSPTDLFTSPLLSLGARARLLKEPFVKGLPSENPSVYDFFAHRLGTEAADFLVDPFMAGVFAGDPRRLEMRTAFRKLWQLVQANGSLTKGLPAQKKAAKGQPKAEISAFRGGNAQLTDALAAGLGGALHLGTRVVSVSHDAAGYTVTYQSPSGNQTLHAPALLLALPAEPLGLLLQNLSPKFARMVEAVPYPAVRVVHVGYNLADVPRKLDGFGYLVPSSESRQILGAIWNSAQFEGAAPAGNALFTLFGGGTRTTPPPTMDHMIADFAQTMGITSQPSFQQEYLWDRAIPQYLPGHNKLEQIATDAEAANPGLFLGGNWRGGISVPDCIENAEAQAATIGAYLRQKNA